MATYTFKPYNNTSGGYIYRNIGDYTNSWDAAHNNTSGQLVNNLSTNYIQAAEKTNFYVGGSGGPATTAFISRSYLMFDTAPTIADDEAILGGRLKLYMSPYFYSWDVSTTTYICAVVAADFANDITVVADDYNDFGSVLLSNEVTFLKSDGENTARWITFTLTAAGIEKIVKTAGTYTAFGIRMKEDIDDTAPIKDLEKKIYYTSHRGTEAYKPILEVDYPGPVLKRYNGIDWEDAHLKRYNGTGWEDAVLKYYDGDSFEDVTSTG